MDTASMWDAAPGYLNTATYGLPPRVAADAVADAVTGWRTGRTDFADWDQCVPRARAAFARLTGVPASSVAVGAAVSAQLGLVAAALPDQARVLVPDGEFTSNLFPWLVQADRGVQVTSVPLDRLAESIDARTTLVAFSLVQSATGQVAALAQITEAARQHGALVAVDATQACGWLPFDASTVDVLAVHAYKWLMSPRGASFLVVSPELRDRIPASGAGWYAGEDPSTSYYGLPLRLAADARRLDVSPAWIPWVGTAAALGVIEQIGIPAIQAHDLRLAGRLRDGLGLPPGDSAILTAEIPGAQERLARAGIKASARAGRTRLSCHIYTTDEDVDAALNALTG